MSEPLPTRCGVSQLENVAHEVRMVAAANLPADATEAQRIAEIRRLLKERQREDRAAREGALGDRVAEWTAGAPRCACGAVGRADEEIPECSICDMFVCSECECWSGLDDGISTECESCWWEGAFGS